MKKQRTFKFMSALMAALMLLTLLPTGAWAQPIATTDSEGLYSLIEGFESEPLGSDYAFTTNYYDSPGLGKHYACANSSFSVVADSVKGSQVLQAVRTNVNTEVGPVIQFNFPKITEGVWELSYDFKQESYPSYYNTVFINIGGFAPYRQYNDYLASATTADIYKDENGKLLVDLTKWTKLTNVFDYNTDSWTLKAQNLEDDGTEIVLETKQLSEISNVANGFSSMILYSYYLAGATTLGTAQADGTVAAKAWWDNISVVQTAKKRVAPEVTANIADGAAGVSLDEEFTLTFNQDMNKDTYDGIQLKNKTTGAAMTATIGTETATTVSFRAPKLLDELTEYEIVVPSTVKTADGQSADATISFATTNMPDFYLHDNFDDMGELEHTGAVGDYFNYSGKSDFKSRYRALKPNGVDDGMGGAIDIYHTEGYNDSLGLITEYSHYATLQTTGLSATGGRLKYWCIATETDRSSSLFDLFYPGTWSAGKDESLKQSITTAEKVKFDFEAKDWNCAYATFLSLSSATAIGGGTQLKLSTQNFGYAPSDVVLGTTEGKHSIEIITDYETGKFWAIYDGVKTAAIDTTAEASQGYLRFWYTGCDQGELYIDNLSVSELARPEVLKIADVKVGNKLVVMLNTPADAQAMVVKDSTGNVVSGTWTVDATKTKYTFSGTLAAGNYSVTMPKDTLSTDGIATLAEATTDFAVKETVNDIEVVNMTILNGTGEELTDVSKAGSILVKAQLQNNKAEAITPFVGVAVYDSDGKLLNIAYSNESIPTGGKTVKLTVSAKGAATAKIFTWDKMGTLSPLASATVR